MTQKQFIKEFMDNVFIPLKYTCNLLKIKPHYIFLEDDSTTVINVTVVYKKRYKEINIDNDKKINLYYFQVDIVKNVIESFYKELLNNFHIFSDIEKENKDFTFYKSSNKTAIFVSSDSFEGFTITLTDE